MSGAMAQVSAVPWQSPRRCHPRGPTPLTHKQFSTSCRTNTPPNGTGMIMALNPRQSNRHLRSKVCAKVYSEETVCWLCGIYVDQTLTFIPGTHGRNCRDESCPGCKWHPLSKSVDEIVPVSKGGDPFDRDNCRLAHRQCNIRRGNRDVVEVRQIVRPLTTRRSW